MLHIDNEEVRGLYEPGKEIDVFSTPEELNQKIAYYLDHPEERMRIADAGHKRAVPAYSYDARAAEIVEIIRNYMAERA
jgi:spore maturation protein CgeB